VKIPTNAEDRHILANKLRALVQAQIDLSEMACEIAEVLDVDFEWIHDYCQRYAIQIESGEEFEDVDVRVFLDILLRKRVPKVWFGKLVMTTN
jgi:hypothetical protein